MRFRISTAIAVSALLVVPAGAAATTVSVASGPDNVYSSSTYAIDQGGGLDFINDSDRPHDLISVGLFSSRPLFRAPRLAPGSSTTVPGVEYLVAGTYPFFCSLHPGMEANLVVNSGGTPLERPAVAARIISATKSALLRSGTVRIALSTATAVSGVTLRLSFLGTVRASRSLDLLPGSSVPVSLDIPKAIRRRIARLRALRLQITGSVPLGVFHGASRTVR